MPASYHTGVNQGHPHASVQQSQDEVKLLSENQSVYIPLGAMHLMENPGKVPMVLIEVQTGVYLEENDIVR